MNVLRIAICDDDALYRDELSRLIKEYIRQSILHVHMANISSRAEAYSASNEQFKKERHDFRHTMRMLATLVKKEQYGQLQQIALDYLETSQSNLLEKYCDYTILDAVLSSYLGGAKRKDIQVSTKLILQKSLPVNETELATVPANTIQACERVETPMRYIEVKVRIKDVSINLKTVIFLNVCL